MGIEDDDERAIAWLPLQAQQDENSPADMVHPGAHKWKAFGLKFGVGYSGHQSFSRKRTAVCGVISGGS